MIVKSVDEFCNLTGRKIRKILFTNVIKKKNFSLEFLDRCQTFSGIYLKIHLEFPKNLLAEIFLIYRSFRDVFTLSFLSFSYNLLKYVLKICGLNFEIVAVTRPCIRFFSFR